MKNNKFIKFSLTVACAAVLAACGSSGGSGDDEAAKQLAKYDDVVYLFMSSKDIYKFEDKVIKAKEELDA